MTIQQILFMIVAAATLGAALMVVSVPNLVHAALWLIGTLFGVAILFVFHQRGISGCSSGGDLHRRHINLDDFCNHADAGM